MKEGRQPVKMFIGGLPGAMTNVELLEALGNPFSVQVKIKRRRDNLTSLGYAFIKFADRLLAQSMANKTYNVCGRKLTLQYCKNEEDESRVDNDTGRLFVRGIQQKTSDEELSKFFASILPCKNAYAIRRQSGQHQGFGFIDLWNQNDANYLVSFKEVEFEGNTLQIELYRKKGKKATRDEVTKLIRPQHLIAKDAEMPGCRHNVKSTLIDSGSTCGYDFYQSSFDKFKISPNPLGTKFEKPIAGKVSKHRYLRCPDKKQHVNGSEYDPDHKCHNALPYAFNLTTGLSKMIKSTRRPDHYDDAGIPHYVLNRPSLVSDGKQHGCDNLRFNILERRA